MVARLTKLNKGNFSKKPANVPLDKFEQPAPSSGESGNFQNKDKRPVMDVHRDSRLPNPAKIHFNAAVPGFDATFTTSGDSHRPVSSTSSASTSSMDDAESHNRETAMTCGDSGFSEMDLTSSGSENVPEPDNGRLSSMDVNEEDDDVSSTISDISGVSDLSGSDWKASGPMGWVQRQIHMGVDPRHVLAKIVPTIPPDTDDFTLWKIVVKLISEIPWRKKLPEVNTLADVVALIRRSSRILVLTGAGVSVSCGIPDFRSPKGIYARLARDFPDLPDPHAMFDIRYFNRDPRPFFKFAREIYPGQFQPSPCHKFIRALEAHGKLLRNYTQNIDTLEQVAGIERVVQCHGSFATATCTNCKRKVGADEIREDILAQRIPVCPVCIPEGAEMALNNLETDFSGLVARGVMKPDIVFFGEGLPQDFHEAMAQDRDQADLLLIIGSSLKVQPVALIPSSVPPTVPQVLINREPLPDCKVDVELLGDADVLVDHLCRALGGDWNDLCWRDSPLTEAESLLPVESAAPTDMANVALDTCNTSVPECSRKRSCSPGSPQPAKKARTEERIDSVDSINAPDSETMDSSLAGGEVASSSGQLDEEWRDARQIKLRQMSSDSTRDSGIAETCEERSPLSLSTRLPESSFLFVAPNRYIFPGAEVYPTRTRRRPSFSDSDLYTSSVTSSPSRDSPPPSPQPPPPSDEQ